MSPDMPRTASLRLQQQSCPLRIRALVHLRIFPGHFMSHFIAHRSLRRRRMVFAAGWAFILLAIAYGFLDRRPRVDQMSLSYRHYWQGAPARLFGMLTHRQSPSYAAGRRQDRCDGSIRAETSLLACVGGHRAGCTALYRRGWPSLAIVRPAEDLSQSCAISGANALSASAWRYNPAGDVT